MVDIIKDMYNFEIELSDGTIITEGDDFDKSEVIRISYIPTIDLVPKHDIIFDGFKLVKRFSRTLFKAKTGIKEKLHVVVTDKFRIYIFSKSGKVLVTSKDYELYF